MRNTVSKTKVDSELERLLRIEWRDCSGGEIAQRIEAMPDAMSSIPRAHMVEGELISVLSHL